jgi:hypothetical protein
MTSSPTNEPESDRCAIAREPERLRAEEAAIDVSDARQHVETGSAEQGRFDQVTPGVVDISGRAGDVDRLRALEAAKHTVAALAPAEVRAARACRGTPQAGPTHRFIGERAGRPGAGSAAGELS